MVKTRFVPLATSVLSDARSEIISALSQLKKHYGKMLAFKVEGPYVVADYKPGETFERIDPVGGYKIGPPNAYVGICVDQTIQKQHFHPFEKDERIKEAFNKLERKLGIKILPSVMCLRELNGSLMDPDAGIKYMFSDRYVLTPQTIS